MTLSATFSVNGSTAVQAHSGAYASTFTFVIQSLTGIETISWSIVGTSKSDQSAPSISLSGTPSGSTATVTQVANPGDGLGRSFLMKLTVSNQQESATSYRVFGTANSAGIIPVCANEEAHRSATHGYTDVFNQALNAIGGAAGSSGNLLYNNAGAIDGAASISVVGSETALAFGATVSSKGLLRTPEGGFGSDGGLIISGLNAAGTQSMNILRADNTDKVFLGDPTYAAQVVASVQTGGKFAIRVNNSEQYAFTSTEFDMNGKNLQEVGAFDHDGTTFGVYGTTPIAKQTGVAVSAAGIHAALVNLGFISA